MMNVVGYVRVSTQEQATEGVSLEAQEARIRAYCTAREWECERVIVDAGQSAGSLKRPGLEELIGLCKRRKIAGVVVLKLDRLTRSVKDLGYLLEDVFGKHGIEFTSVADNFDTTTANGRLVLNLLGSVAQWEREIVAERTSDALQHLKRQGVRYGQVPFGYQLGLDGIALEEDEEQQAVIGRMASWREAGASLRKIAERLTADGIATANGGQWWPATVKSVLATSGVTA